MRDTIYRDSAIDEIEILLEQSEDDEHDKTWNNAIRSSINAVKHHLPSAQPEIVRCKDCKLFGNSEQLPSAQPEIIRCKDCEYGEQDEVGRWFCRSLGCQIGNEDGSGYCADALNRKEGAKDD